MSSPGQGLFKRAMANVFGPSTPLENETTIDYNDTVRSKASNPDRYSHKDLFADDFSEARVIEDSDEELSHDVDYIFNRYHHTNDMVKNLPRNYPGRFNTPEPSYEENVRKTKNNEINDYDYQRPRERLRWASEPFLISVDRDLKKMEEEINLERDINTARMNAGYNQFPLQGSSQGRRNELDLNDLVNRVQERNSFLEKLNDYAVINEQHRLSSDIASKYDSLRKEYIEELEAHQKFYNAYYKLMFKYRTLKKITPSKHPNSSVIMREKVNLIKMNSLQPSVKLACNILANELDKNDNLLLYYENELSNASKRIEQLERQMSH